MLVNTNNYHCKKYAGTIEKDVVMTGLVVILIAAASYFNNTWGTQFSDTA